MKFTRATVPPVNRISAVLPDEMLREQLDGRSAYTKITLTDNGIGFDQQYADSIFRMLFPAEFKKPVRRYRAGISPVPENSRAVWRYYTGLQEGKRGSNVYHYAKAGVSGASRLRCYKSPAV